MGAQLKCPRCRAAVPLAGVAVGSEVTCPGCGAKLKVNAPTARPPSDPPPPAVPVPVRAAGPDDSYEIVNADPAPADAEPRRSRPKKRKKKPSRAKGGVPKGKVAGVGGAVASILIIVVILLLTRSRPRGGPGAPEDAGDFVVVDAPVAGAAFVPRPAEVLPEPAPRPAPVRPAAADAAAVKPAAALWDLPPDVPPAAPEPIAADLNVPAGRGASPGLHAEPPPLFAALGGPYVVTHHGWEYARFDQKFDEKVRKHVVLPKKLPPLPVIDVRTGRPAGEFASVIPLYDNCRLGPDGRYLVGPEYMPDRNATNREGTLFVFKHKDPEPATRIAMPGHVGWLGFVAPDRVALLTFAPGATLQVWDAGKGVAVQTVPLAAGHVDPPPLPSNATLSGVPKHWYDPAAACVAVSPTGRYVALGGKKGIVIVSLAEGKEVGLVPTDPAEGVSIRGMSFSPDGRQLWAVCLHTARYGSGPRVRMVDFATGRTLREVPVTGDPRTAFDVTGELLPGPEPDTIIYRVSGLGWVLDLQAGLTLDLLPAVVRWGGPDRFLAVTQGADKVRAVRAVPFPREAFRAKVGDTLAAVAPRPAVVKADRTGCAAVKPEPPAEWAPPPAPPKREGAPADPVALGEWPSAFGDAQAAVLASVYREKPQGRNELHWQRVDLCTGRKVGEPRVLWPRTSAPGKAERHPSGRGPAEGDAPLAALTADGGRLAVRDPANPARVDVWSEAGERLVGLEPYGGAPVDWLGWSGGGKLLTRGGGRLTAWDVPAAKAAYEVDGSYDGPAAFAPGRAWLAACAGDAVDLIDAESGKCLGRCRPNLAGGAFAAVAVAPDGGALAAARPALQARDATGPAHLADLWDLATGKSTPVAFGSGKLEFLHWATPKHVLTASGRRDHMGPHVELIDFPGGVVAGAYRMPMAYQRVRPGDGQQSVAATPDGRVWLSVPNVKPTPELPQPRVWQSRPLPNPGGDLERLALAEDRAYCDATGQPVRVEVDAGAKGRSREAAEKLAGELQQKGFTVGPGGWVLRVSHQVEDSGQRMTIGVASRDGDPIPKVQFTYRLLDGGGAEVWRGTADYQFLGRSSKYFLKSKGEFVAAPGGGFTTEYFEFGGRDWRKAIVEEILDTNGGKLAVPAGLPAGKLIRAGGVYKPLPVGTEIAYEYGK